MDTLFKGMLIRLVVAQKLKKQVPSFDEIKQFSDQKNITIEKGSITVNGVSLTVDSNSDSFSVAIIPYTYQNTNFHKLVKGEIVNLEFDVLGKYIAKILDLNK